MTNTSSSLDSLILKLEDLCTALTAQKDLKKKNALLRRRDKVVTTLKSCRWLSDLIATANDEDTLILLSLLAIEQGEPILQTHLPQGPKAENLENLLSQLRPVEHFYQDIGGLVGYHVNVLKLIRGDDLGPLGECTEMTLLRPAGIDLRDPCRSVRQAIIESIERLDQMAEMYPVGGAGDRLNLIDGANGEPLPAAVLTFAGAGNLLEWLIRDVQAKEYLHFKLFDKQVTVPIAMMTSEEKHNHRRISNLCERKQWFGRPQSSFKLFCQPLVPVIRADGVWAVERPFHLFLKPGGHGAIWKLAQDSGTLDWLAKQGCRKALIRQINNPIAGIDYGLCAFTGWGLVHDKLFGFASCERRVNAAEGMDVLIEDRSSQGVSYRVTNIEYTEFSKHGIEDVPCHPGGSYSVFPANTNILFCDLATIQQVIKVCPMPGMLVNMKTSVSVGEGDTVRQVAAGRLEGTMQNIADYIVDLFPQSLDVAHQSQLSTYICYNERQKTLSVIKNTAVHPGTPESCYYDLMTNYRDLLQNHCDITMPELPPFHDMLTGGPPFRLQLHPALGPFFSIIGRKIRQGTISSGSHLVLEITEVDITNLHLAGLLAIIADTPLGIKEANGHIRYSPHSGKCTLRNVTVRNILSAFRPDYWLGHIEEGKGLVIRIQGNGEFVAEDISFDEPMRIEVASGEKVTAGRNPQGKITLKREKISRPSWYWEYHVDDDFNIQLSHLTD